MARTRKSPAGSRKSKQVHFWVDDELTGDFGRVAESIGERLTDAHRAAMKQYVDQNSLEGAHFLLESDFTVGRYKLSARVFAIRPGELVLRLRGGAVETLIRLADRLQSTRDLGDALGRAIEGLTREHAVRRR